MLTIYTNENNPAALKLIIAGKFAEKPITVNIADVNDRSIPPPGHLPCLEIDKSTTIFIPNAALWYIQAGVTEENNTKINEWLEWEASDLTPNLTHLIGTNVRNEKLKNDSIKCLEKLEKQLENQTYLIGDSLTIADIAIWTILYPLVKDSNLSKELLSEHDSITKWFKNCEEKSEFQAALSSFKMANGSVAYQALFSGSKYLFSNSGENQQQQQKEVQNVKIEALTDDELQAAQTVWQMDILNHPKLQPRKQVVPPIVGEKNILITSALPYVNNVPHLGNIIGCVLSADVFARYCRLCNYNTLYIAGTDEYGTATETKALEEGISCKAICDKYFAIHDDIYKWFNISFDHFGRTSTPQQTKICQDLFLQLNNNGFMFTDTVEQLYCEKCNRYLADRFVEGGCPNIGCTYEDARGDQCDGCGKLVNAIELKNPRCKICRNSPKLRQSSQFFFDLPKLEPLLLHWMKKSSPNWSNNARVIAQTWLKEGLKPRCITRDLKWGVPVPLNDYKDKVFYVWFDAPIGYMSITKAYTENWEDWWKPKPNINVTLYQFMAKDNVPFHSVMFPATLLGCNRGYTTVSHIMATEYLNYEDGKFSKSRGVGVFGNDARDTGIPSDVWRFYLLYVRPESQDSSFSWSDLATKNNSELLNNLGNFINRALMFAKNNFNKTVPEMKPIKDDFVFLAMCNRELKSYMNCLKKCKLRDGLRHILAISRHGNQYMQVNQPWVLLKGSPEEKIRASTIIGICCNIACLLSMLLNPYMPETSDNLKKQLNARDTALIPEISEVCQLLPAGHKLGEMAPLFAKLEPTKVEELKQRFAGKQQSQQEQQKQKQSLSQQQQQTKDVKLLEAEVAKQADKVRALKSNGVDKKVWQPEVETLLKLKKDLEIAQKNTSTCSATVTSNSEVAKKLEDEIAKQGDVVRKLKEGGANKSEWQPEVNKLLELKTKLANLLGVPLEDTSKKGKKTKK